MSGAIPLVSAAEQTSMSVAHRAWQALLDSGLQPTPRGFELFYAHFSGLNPPLSEQLSPHLSGAQPLTAAGAEAIYEACLAGSRSEDAVDVGADEMADAAARVVEDVHSYGEVLTGFGGVLDHWAARMQTQSSVSELAKAIQVLTAETMRTSARNRVLEQQVTASALRIAKLRQELVGARQEAMVDTLTGLANRKAFDARLRRAVAPKRGETAEALTLLMVDIDHFKRFNDQHGHRTGDQVLRLVGRLLSDNVKGRDTAARYGGEEFAVLLLGADLHASASVARQICERLGAQRLIKRGTNEDLGRVTISVGVAQHRRGEGGAALVERADRALYQAKHTGRNRVCLASEE